MRDGASAGLARSLSELRTALSEADLPEEAASRSIIEDARSLTAEIEARIEEGRREADAARRGRRDRLDGRDLARPADGETSDRGDRGDDDRGVRIDVTDPNPDREDGSDGTGPADGPAEPDDDPAPEVDVESELESIKRQLGDDEAAVGDAAAEIDPDSPDDDSDDAEADGAEADEADAARGDDDDRDSV